MLIVVSYDVVADRRRAKLAHALKDFGKRVQKSVFECDLEPSQLDRLRSRAKRLIDDEEDSVRIYLFCAGCRDRVEVLGMPPEVYIL